jgi:hypothetical protein
VRKALCRSIGEESLHATSNLYAADPQDEARDLFKFFDADVRQMQTQGLKFGCE